MAKVTNKTIRTIAESATLEFNREELEFLRDILNNIGGSPNTSRRKHAVSIREALSTIMDVEPPRGGVPDKTGDITFLDWDEMAKKNADAAKKAKRKTWNGMSRYDIDEEIPF